MVNFHSLPQELDPQVLSTHVLRIRSPVILQNTGADINARAHGRSIKPTKSSTERCVCESGGGGHNGLCTERKYQRVLEDKRSHG